MDYQCIIVYTVISIVPKRYEEIRRFNNKMDEKSTGCFGCVKRAIKSALTNYRRTDQTSALVYANQACVYYDEGLVDEAIQHYQKAIVLKPEFPDAYCNLANAYKHKGDINQAVKYYKKALKQCPEHADSLNNLANVKREMGHIEEALQLYGAALEVQPSFAVAHSNLASMLHQQGKFSEALKHYQTAIHIQPNFADAYSNMGNVLKELHNISGAIFCYKRALQSNSGFADARCNLASLFKDLGKLEEAIMYYKQALECKPDFPDAFCSLTYCQLMCCNWNDYEVRIHKVVDTLYNQKQYNRLPSVHPHHTMLYPLPAEIIKFIATKHADLSFEKVSIMKQQIYSHKQKKPVPERLKIGYVSSDFGNHPTSHLMQSIPGLHDRTNFEIFCYCLGANDKSAFRQKIETESENFVDVSKLTLMEATKKINSDGIHILINMNGYTKGARNDIFAAKPAPIQVMWLGYPGTSGALYMDYIITDAVTSPKDFSKHHFSEKLAYMPHSYFIGDHRNMFPHLNSYFIISEQQQQTSANGDLLTTNKIIANVTDVSRIKSCCRNDKNVTFDVMKFSTGRINVIRIPSLKPIKEMIKNNEKSVNIGNMLIQNGALISNINTTVANGELPPCDLIVTCRQQYGIPENAIVYCNFNQLYKIDPTTFKTWINILNAVPNSVMWLLRFPQNGENHLKETAYKYGLPISKLIFTDVAPKEEHVRRAQIVDVCLDTYVCNGHTTNMDVLWAGTPVVTLPGQTLASRVAASQLTALGCEELIAKTRAHYEKIAIKLGRDKLYLQAIRATILNNKNTSPLFNCHLYTKDLEELFKKMWKRYVSSGQPTHLI